LEGVPGGDRSGGAEQVGRVEIGFTAETRRKPGILTAKDAEGAKRKSGKRGTGLGPSFAVKAPLIQDDSLKRSEFAPRSLFRRESTRKARIGKAKDGRRRFTQKGADKNRRLDIVAIKASAQPVFTV
jgi:hypothetical protein